MQADGHDRSPFPETPDPFLDKTMELLSLRALHDADPLTRKHSLYMLGLAADPGTVDTCIKAMRDPEKAVRGQAARALAGIGEPAVFPLVSLLGDPDWRIRYRAAEALGMIRAKSAVTSLIGKLSDTKDHVRYMAVKSLCLIGDSAARDPVMACLHDENPFVRKMAEKAVSRLLK